MEIANFSPRILSSISFMPIYLLRQVEPSIGALLIFMPIPSSEKHFLPIIWFRTKTPLILLPFTQISFIHFKVGFSLYASSKSRQISEGKRMDNIDILSSGASVKIVMERFPFGLCHEFCLCPFPFICSSAPNTKTLFPIISTSNFSVISIVELTRSHQLTTNYFSPLTKLLTSDFFANCSKYRLVCCWIFPYGCIKIYYI